MTDENSGSQDIPTSDNGFVEGQINVGIGPDGKVAIASPAPMIVMDAEEARRLGRTLIQQANEADEMKKNPPKEESRIILQ